MTAGMAEVIAAHEYKFIPLACKCGVACGADEDELTYAAHLTEELAKAGCGNVHEAKAEAVRETAVEWAAYQSARMPRSDVLQVPVWLNQRADTMEAPQHG